MAQADIGEYPGRPMVGALTRWLCTRPFLVDVERDGLRGLEDVRRR